MSIETLAEGIERPHELDLLKDEQCDSGQGFLFARPLDAITAEAFFRTWQGELAEPFAQPLTLPALRLVGGDGARQRLARRPRRPLSPARTISETTAPPASRCG